MPRKIARPAEDGLLSAEELEAIKRDVIQFEGLREQMELLEKRQNEIKGRLKGVIEELGEEDDKGNLILPFDDDFAEQYHVSSLMNQRRVTQKLDETKAEKILDKHGLLADCQTTVVTLDQDKIMAQYFEGNLTEDEVDAMITKKVTFAFCPQRVKK